MEGQLIIIGKNYFSFAWVPLSHQILFGRPSSEILFELLRENGSHDLLARRQWKEPPSANHNMEACKEYAEDSLRSTTEYMIKELDGLERTGLGILNPPPMGPPLCRLIMDL